MSQYGVIFCRNDPREESYLLGIFDDEVDLIIGGKEWKTIERFQLGRVGLEPVQGLEIEPAGLPDLVAEGRRRFHDLHVEVNVVA